LSQSTADRRREEIDSLVVGFMVPIFSEVDPRTGKTVNALGPTDFHRAMSGYGCPDCLAIFRTYLVRCPVCRHQRDVFEDMRQMPEMWRQHLDDRNSGFAHNLKKPLTKFDPDEFIRSVQEDPEVEQIPAEKLRPKHRPRMA